MTMRETQQAALEILHTVAQICEEKNFRYYLVYGTLIGAVRHNGFIPWDDDVDIMMPRPDYDKLLDYLGEHIGEYPHLEVFNRETCEAYPYMITRISDDRYEIIMENEKPFGMGIFIDIYPYDGLGNDQKEAVRFGMKGDRLSSLCYQATRDHFAIETTTSFFRKCIKMPVYLFCRLCGKERFQDALEKLARVRPYDESRFVGCVIWLSWASKICTCANGSRDIRICPSRDTVSVYPQTTIRSCGTPTGTTCSCLPKRTASDTTTIKHTAKTADHLAVFLK